MVVGVVILIAFVALGGNKTTPPPPAPLRQAMPQTITDAVQTGWNPTLAEKVGFPSSVTAPTLTPAGTAALVAPGSTLPTVAFVGAEFCPYCAGERWALVMALGQFGKFGQLNQTTSSSSDVYPSTVTFSFYPSASYTSTLINFATSEVQNNLRANLQTPPSWMAALWQKYDNPQGYPFLDIGNQVLVTTPSYLPTSLSGLTADEIQATLGNSSLPSAQAIVGTATYVIAGICSIDGEQPSAVCSSAPVTQAKTKIGIK